MNTQALRERFKLLGGKMYVMQSLVRHFNFDRAPESHKSKMAA